MLQSKLDEKEQRKIERINDWLRISHKMPPEQLEEFKQKAAKYKEMFSGISENTQEWDLPIPPMWVTVSLPTIGAASDKDADFTDPTVWVWAWRDPDDAPERAGPLISLSRWWGEKVDTVLAWASEDASRTLEYKEDGGEWSFPHWLSAQQIAEEKAALYCLQDARFVLDLFSKNREIWIQQRPFWEHGLGRIPNFRSA